MLKYGTSSKNDNGKTSDEAKEEVSNETNNSIKQQMPADDLMFNFGIKCNSN